MYVLRSMKTLSQTAIPRLYDRERVSLQERVKKAPAVCLLSTIATTSFMYITCHFIENYNMFFLVFFCYVTKIILLCKCLQRITAHHQIKETGTTG